MLYRMDPQLLVDLMKKEGGDRPFVLSPNWAEHLKVVETVDIKL